jgi:heme/copper-type cytochrome/quinol oxidase subunit 2
MISLAGGPIRVGSGVAATGDWRTLVALVVVMVIAFAAIAVVDYRKNKRQPSRKHESADSERKAA